MNTPGQTATGPGLYIHVPFCASQCAYCAFFSMAPARELVAAWLAGIRRDLSELPDGFAPATVYIGGGTPTALEEEDLARLFELLAGHVELGGAGEWSCEVNPGTLTPAKAALLRAAGVNRLSIGAQSFHPDTLRLLGRGHHADDTRASVELARQAGFRHIALDLIYGVPGVTVAMFAADLEAALALEPEHVSCYCLEIEPGTPFSRRAAAGELAIDEGEQRRQFELSRRVLTAGGLGHYEISNFALPGRECRHNGLYWSGGEYLGIGPAAHSHWRGQRWGHTEELPEWSRAFEETLEPAAKARETLVMGLRRIAGWNRREFRAATGFEINDLRGREIARLAADGLLVETQESLRLADDALFISDTVFAELV